MPADAWKEKYLSMLEQFDAQEAAWQSRFDLLRRSLVRTSMTVEGRDADVDRCMRELREMLRKVPSDQQLEALVPRLEQVLMDSDRRRGERLEQISGSIRRLVDHLKLLSGARSFGRELRRFRRGIEGRVGLLADLQLMLHELAELHGQVVEASMPEDMREQRGMLQRLFGRNEDAPVASAAEDVAEPRVADEVEPPAAVLGRGSVQAAAPRPVKAEPVELLESPDAPAGRAIEVAEDTEGEFASPELNAAIYSAIGQRIEAALLTLMDQLQLPAVQESSATALRERVSRGLNWYELVTVIDDLSELLKCSFGLDALWFDEYLAQLGQRLGIVQDSLALVADGQQQDREAAEVLGLSLRSQVSSLEQGSRESLDLQGLRAVVQGHMADVLQTVDSYQAQCREREQQSRESLQVLRERLETVEGTVCELKEQLEDQRRLARHDALTGLPNRVALMDRLDHEVSRWQTEGGEPLLVALLDIDYFKQINDTYGHLVGDRVLKIIGDKWRSGLRKTDFLARYGGEEFVLLLPATPPEVGQAVVEALRAGIGDCPFHFKGQRVRITVSAGLTAMKAEDPHVEVTFDRADRALYLAKRKGRDRLECAYGPPATEHCLLDES